MDVQFNIGEIVAKRAYMHPDKQAINDALAGRRFSYAALNSRVNRLCAALHALGLAKSDRVALLMYNGHEFLEAFFAIAKSGLVAVPISWRLTPDEIGYMLQDCGASAVIFDSELGAAVAECRRCGEGVSAIASWIEVRGHGSDFAFEYERLILAQPDDKPPPSAGEEDNLFIMYTSGTTGLPKGAVHTHKSTSWSVLNFSVTAGMHFEDNHLVSLPLFHIAALIGSVTALYNGNTLVVMRSFDPATNWKLIVDERIATSFAVPAMLEFMLQVPDFEKCDWSSLRWIMSGGAPLSVETIEAYQRVGIEITQAFGMTEACGSLCMVGPDDGRRKAGTVGKACFHTQLRIVDPDGNELPPGVAGEIIARSPTIMKEYWSRPEDTAAAIRNGWYHTGDVGVRDDEGFITIKDRIRDMVISGGENVYPAEVERVLMQHPDIIDVAVIGQHSRKWGESPFAVVVGSSAGLSEADVLSFCNDKLARFKVPKGVAFVDELPRNPTGKVLKRVLREQFPGPAPE